MRVSEGFVQVLRAYGGARVGALTCHAENLVMWGGAKNFVFLSNDTLTSPEREVKRKLRILLRLQGTELKVWDLRGKSYE